MCLSVKSSGRDLFNDSGRDALEEGLDMDMAEDGLEDVDDLLDGVVPRSLSFFASLEE